MKTYILLLGFIIFAITETHPQNINSKITDVLSYENCPYSLPEIKDDGFEPFHYYFSYGNAPNEVIFNKDFDKSYVSAMSHNFDFGIALVNKGKKVSMEFNFSAFYQFSKQKNSGTGEFEMEYNGFGIKTPEVAFTYELGNLGFRFYYPIPIDFGWYKFSNVNYPSSFSEKERNFLENYNEQLKFSSAREFGLGLNIGNNFSLNLGYEGRLFHPSYKFLQQATGNAIELGVFAFSYLMTYTMFMSPGSNASIYTGLLFLLVPEATSFGMLQLRKNSINWPFESEAPLYYNSLKISANVYF
jgi:hypothetical protein